MKVKGKLVGTFWGFHGGGVSSRGLQELPWRWRQYGLLKSQHPITTHHTASKPRRLRLERWICPRA